MTINEWEGIATTEAFYAFFAYCGDHVIIDSKFNFLASSFNYEQTVAFRRLYMHTYIYKH